MDPMTAAAGSMALGSALVGGLGQRSARRRQRREIDRGQQMAGQLDERARTRVDTLTRDIEGITPDQFAGGLRTDYGRAVAGVDPRQFAGPAIPGASSRFAEGMDRVAGDVRDYGGQLTDYLVRQQAPMLARGRRGEAVQRAGVDLQDLAREAQARGALTEQAVGAQQANPWIQALAQMGQGVAMGMAGQGGGGGAGVAPTGSSAHMRLPRGGARAV